MDLDELYRLMRGAHVQAQGMIDTVRDPLLVLNEQLMAVNANLAFYETFRMSREETIGVSFFELGGGQWNIDELKVLLKRVIPRTSAVEDFEVNADFGDIGKRTMLVTARRLVRPDMSGRVLLLTLVDATKRREAEATTAILVGELQHRMKNLLGLVQALVRQTHIDGRSAADFRESLIGRLEALSRSLDGSLSGQATSLSKLVAETLEPYSPLSAAVEIDGGPDLALAQQQALGVGLILHELSTNAAKYGGLSSPDGRLRIGWTVKPDGQGRDQLQFEWREMGGPAVSPPKTHGFGTRLIQFAADKELGGEAELTYAPDGFSARVRFPLQQET